MSWLTRKTIFQKKQELAAPSSYYGNGGTIHHSGTIDIDVDKSGHVIQVWFRCRTLPFRVSFLDEYGDREPTGYGSTDELGSITGVEIYHAER